MLPIIVAVLSSGALTALAGGWLARRKTNAEADNTIVRTAESVVAMQNQQLEALNGQVQSLSKRVTDVEARLSKEQRETERLRRWVRLLLGQLRHLGVEPVEEPAE